jgi:trehalose monomycolate/heme transporter
MFAHLGRLLCRFPWLFVAVATVVVGMAAGFGADVVKHLTLAPGWDVPNSGSELALLQLRDRLGKDETPVIVLFRAKPGLPANVDDPAFRNAVEAALAGIGQNPDVSGVQSYYGNADTRLRSAKGDSTYALIKLKLASDEGMSAYQRLRAQLHSERVEIELGGELATYVDVREQLAKDIWNAEIVSFVLLAMLLVWVFGSAVAAALPLVIGGVTIVLSAALLKFFTLFTDISVYAANVVSMLGLGLAIDYGLFIVSRYREELARGGSPELVLFATLSTAGRTVAYSGLTVAASLFCLLLMPQRFFQNMGLAGAISVGSAMITSVVVLPALLALLGPRVNRLALPVLAKRGAREEGSGGWYRFSQIVMRHALPVLISAFVLLGVMGLPVLHMEVGPSDSKSLPTSAESRHVQETLDRDFRHAELSPLVLTVRAGGPAHAAAGLAGLHELTGRIQALPGVTRVAGLASLTDPHNQAGALALADYQLMYEYPDQFPVAKVGLQEFAKGPDSLVFVYYQQAPTSLEARALVRQIRAVSLPKGLKEVQVGGFPAFHLDYVESLRAWVPWVILAIVCVIFVLLFLMLGSVLVPLKAVITNLFSLSATFGILVWIFQDGNLSGLLNFTPQGSMDGTILVLIFASAFGLSIDYEVFLLSRVKEMCVATGDNMRAVAAGIQKSGPIITSAALLIGIVLGTFAMGEVVFMKAMGLGLLLSVIVDATLVRMLLVPASLRLLGRLNWWAPKPLLMIYQRFHLSEIDPRQHEEKR